MSDKTLELMMALSEAIQERDWTYIRTQDERNAADAVVRKAQARLDKTLAIASREDEA